MNSSSLQMQTIPQYGLLYVLKEYSKRDDTLPLGFIPIGTDVARVGISMQVLQKFINRFFPI